MSDALNEVTKWARVIVEAHERRELGEQKVAAATQAYVTRAMTTCTTEEGRMERRRLLAASHEAELFHLQALEDFEEAELNIRRLLQLGGRATETERVAVGVLNLLGALGNEKGSA